MRYPALALLLLAGCVEQSPGLTVTVEVAPVARAAVDTPMGTLALDEAWLTVAAVELVPCTVTARRWWWPIGVARAHGEVEGTLRVVVDAPIEPLAGPQTLGAIAVPPDLSVCGLRLDLGDAPAVRLAGTIDGTRYAWLAAPELGAPLPMGALALDEERRAATVTLRVDVADWVADLPTDIAAQAAVVAANAVAGLYATVE